MITESVSIKNTAPTIGIKNTLPDNIEIDATAPPKANEPVSPINILAGWWLKYKNPNNPPTNEMQITEILLNPAVLQIYVNAKKKIADVPLANPSSPSVKLTALTVPKMTINRKGTVNIPKLIYSPVVKGIQNSVGF